MELTCALACVSRAAGIATPAQMAAPRFACSYAALQIAPTEVRGALGSVNQLVICLGILGALLVNVVFPPAAWRTMFYLSALPAILLGLGAHTTASARALSRL